MEPSSADNRRMNYYDVLEVSSSADQTTIRKAYLKKSLKYHPDKNPGREDEVKPYFVLVGQAYEALSDPERRRQYDQDLSSFDRRRRRQPCDGGGSANADQPAESPRTYTDSSYNDCTDPNSSSSSNAYEMYRDVFDETVASMSEEELAATIGVVSAVAGIVGSFVGSKLLGGNAGARAGAARGPGTASVASSLLAQAGSIAGSVIATELAVSSVRAIHQESLERLQYKEECRQAIERGEPIPERPQRPSRGGFMNSDRNNNNNSSRNKWKTVLQQTVQSVQSKVGMR